MHIIVVVGLFTQFLLALVAQALVELRDILTALAFKTVGGLSRGSRRGE